MTPAASRADVCTLARGWLRTPWHHQARIRGVGVDCAQLLIAVYAEAGVIKDFDPGNYAIDHMMHSDREVFRGWCERYGRQTKTPRAGDAVVWKFGRVYSHGGIVVEWPGRVIHAFRPFGEVCETPADASRLAGRDAIFFTFWDDDDHGR